MRTTRRVVQVPASRATIVKVPFGSAPAVCLPVEAVDKRVGRSVRDGGMRGLPTFLSTASVSALPADACSYLGSVLRSGIVGQNVTMGTVLGVGG